MTVFGITEKGKYRKENQDAILIRQKGKSGLFIVADGVGGGVNSAEVSSYITESYAEWWDGIFLRRERDGFQLLFEEAKFYAEQINRDICRKYGIGTSASTMVLLLIHQNICGYISVGDSRIYRSNQKGTRVITRDDTWENRPDADLQSVHVGKILSAVGWDYELEYSCATDCLMKREVFFLCSDGIYRYVEEAFLEKQLEKARRCWRFRKEILEEVADRAVERDTTDNYSLIIVKT